MSRSSPVSQSTPHRPSGSKHTSSNHFSDTHAPKQEILKQMIANELADATWELDPVTLARALSSKTRKAGVPPLTIDKIDDLEHYDIEIDQLGGLLDDAVQALKQAFVQLPMDGLESEHYQPLMTFLNACVGACGGVYNKSLFYNKLKFIIFDTSMQDRVRGASPLKPDGAGGNGLSEGNKQLWWRPESGDRSSTLEIPVEVKGVWADLVSQAGTYSRALSSARPLRQFSLVIAYNHKGHELRFLVFHTGGLTASRALYPNQPKDHTDIVRLILSLLTWKSAGDAGLPEWTNDVEMFVQKDENDREGLRMHVKEVLYERLGVRGRGVQVSRLCLVDDTSESPTPAAPVATATTQRRSARIAEKTRRDTELRRGTGSVHRMPSNRSSQTAETSSEDKDQLKGTSSISLFKDRSINFIHRQLHDFSVKIEAKTTDIVSKCSSVGKSHVSIESRMMKECGGMFGVMTYYHSSVVCHKEALPSTNHLFLNDAEFWQLYIRSDRKPDFRVSVQHFSQFAGHSLVTVRKPRDLFVAIVHTALGYRNMIERGFQHRDISIGNILWIDTSPKTKPVFDTFRDDDPPADDYEMRLKRQLQQSGVYDRCCGFVIDGDMAIELKSYFTEAHDGSRSGTDEFMSDDLLEAAKLDIPYLQSPVDDLWSFYYVAQWAAVFNNVDFPGNTPLPVKLAELRRQISGSHADRALGTLKIIGPVMDQIEYGQFLADCYSILSQWRSKLNQLTADWRAARVDAIIDGDARCLYFREYTNRGILELMQLVQQKFPGSLSLVHH